MSPISALLASLATALEAEPGAAAEAARIVRALGLAPANPAEETIPLAKVTEHGAPSPAWVRERARRGDIEILGPRGARFVRAADLRTLLESTTIARRSKPAQTTTLADDARSAVVDLAERRTRRTGT